MDNITLNDLQADPKNPRFITEDQYKKLKKLLAEFGDLSGIVRNQTTDQLVGGHMRVKAFQERGGTIQITQQLDEPTKTGTVALGYVVIDGEPFTYREVRWDEGRQRAANAAANEAGGGWDKALLAENIYNLSQLDNGDELLSLTGFDDDEITALLNDTPGVVEEKQDANPGLQRISFMVSDSQAETINQAVLYIKAHRSFENISNDDQTGNAVYFVARAFLDSVSE